MVKVKVAVHVSDPISAAGLREYIDQSSELVLAEETPQVRVLVLEWRSGGAVSLLRKYADESVPQILIGELPHAGLFRALDAGLTAVLPPWSVDSQRLTKTVKAVAAGKTLLPPKLVTELVGHVRRLQQDVLAPNGLSNSGLTTRELDVLQLLAEGYDTAEIAADLNWAERTVKNIVHVLNARMKLRNRTHAVSWALRNGLI